jgi:hypothetical protein
MEAQKGAMEAHHGAVKVHNRGLEAHNGAMDVGSIGQWLQLRITLMNMVSGTGSASQ